MTALPGGVVRPEGDQVVVVEGHAPGTELRQPVHADTTGSSGARVASPKGSRPCHPTVHNPKLKWSSRLGAKRSSTVPPFVDDNNKPTLPTFPGQTARVRTVGAAVPLGLTPPARPFVPPHLLVPSLNRVNLELWTSVMAPRALPLGPEATPHDHVVLFYSDDAELVAKVGRDLGEAVGAGVVVVALATEAHLRAIAVEMGHAGINVEKARDDGSFSGYDASRDDGAVDLRRLP